MRYLLDLHKKRDLKTDNQETIIWSLHKMSNLLDLHKKRDLKTDK